MAEEERGKQEAGRDNAQTGTAATASPMTAGACALRRQLAGRAYDGATAWLRRTAEAEKEGGMIRKCL
jgi:hypothetical protein